MMASTTGTRLVGAVADSGLTLGALADEHGFATGRLGVLFVDHDKVLEGGWLCCGSIVVADETS
jgi:catechol O-methyltransferase